MKRIWANGNDVAPTINSKAMRWGCLSRVTVLSTSLVLMAAASMAYYHLGIFVPHALAVRAACGLGNGYSFGNDFYPIWLTTRLTQQGQRDLYNQRVTREIQRGLFGRPLDRVNRTDPPIEYRSFAYPAFTDLLFWPAAMLEFPNLRLVLAVVLPVLTITSIGLWMFVLHQPVRPFRFSLLALLALCNYPILEALFAEQPGLIVGFLLASSAANIRRGRLFFAGALLAVTLIKPQMTLLAVIYLAMWSLASRRRIGFWVGFLAVTLALAGASLWVWPHWVGEWIRIVLGYHHYATPPLTKELLGNLLGGYAGIIGIVLLLATGIALAWRGRQANSDSPEFWLTLDLLLAITSVAILPGQAIYDHVILLPGILLLLQYWQRLFAGGTVLRILVVIGAIVLLWPWVAAFGLLVLRPLFPPVQFSSAQILALPIRTAASFPFVVFALLLYLKRVIRMRNQELSSVVPTSP